MVRGTIVAMIINVASIAPRDDVYPVLLREIHNPPDPLFVRGTLPAPDCLMVAVVGSRQATTYGRLAVARIVEPLAARGVVIVSGLALGIDAAAHEAALRVKGTTIAVLGTPVSLITPRANHRLGEQILTGGGAIISEIPLGGSVTKTNFAIRNRIIAGLCQAVLVVEGALESGSLITARAALNENREVFAVPGPITSVTSEGTNNLLKLGARPATEANDILLAIGQPPLPFGKSQKVIDPIREPILAQLSLTDPIHIDKLSQSVTLSLPALQSELSLLELRGRVRMVQPGWYIRIA